MKALPFLLRWATLKVDLVLLSLVEGEADGGDGGGKGRG